MHRPTTSSPLTWVVGVTAAIAASFLLVWYVTLLRDVVAHGGQAKTVQNEPPAAPAKAHRGEAFESSH